MQDPSSTRPAPRPEPGRRLRGIDAARGIAMLFVCLSHFGFGYFRPFQDRIESSAIVTVTMVASPTFMLISGMMLGLLYHTRPRTFPGVIRTLAGRGLFLLTVGHVLIVLSCIPRSDSLYGALTRGFITDAIGVAILIGPHIIQRIGRAGRIALALGLYGLGVWLMLSWIPETTASDFVRYVLSGPLGAGDERYNFPLLAWMALYFVGTVIGEWLGRTYLAGQHARVERGLVLLGAGGVGMAVLLKAGYLAARATGLVERGVSVAYLMTSPLSKLPPSPAYLFFYGGVGLMLTGIVLHVNRRELMPRVIGVLSELGRASLFVFLLQFYVYYVGFHYLALPYSPFWPLYFLVSVVLIVLASRWWLRGHHNRHFDMLGWFGRAGRSPADARHAEG